MKIELYTISTVAEIHIKSHNLKIEESIANMYGEIDLDFIESIEDFLQAMKDHNNMIHQRLKAKAKQ